MNMRALAKLTTPLGLVLALEWAGARPVAAEDELAARVVRSLEVYQELVKAPDRAIPEPLLKDCKCIAIIPHVIKGAFVFGARHGKGIVSCRDSQGRWSPPAFFTLSGGSWGLQIGAEASDVVLFFMTERGAKSLLESKFTLGGTLGVAAGPVGRTAEASTDLKFNAEIYSYARSKGLFAGLSLEGARLAPNKDDIANYYGRGVTYKQLLFEGGPPTVPAEVDAFRKVLP